MNKTIDQLKQEHTDNERKLQQAQHQLQRMNSRIRYYEKGDRQKQAHRLITKGAAIESVMPELKDKSSGTRTQHIHIKYDGLGFIPLDALMKEETA